MNDPINSAIGAFDLHVGLPADEVERFLSDEFVPVTHETGFVPIKFAIGTEQDGDAGGRTSWEQWYEAPWDFNQGGDEPDWEKGHHVVLRCENIASAIENFSWLWFEGFTFIPARFGLSHGTIGVVSQAEDWAEQYVAFDVKQAWQFQPSIKDFPLQHDSETVNEALTAARAALKEYADYSVPETRMSLVLSRLVRAVEAEARS